MAPPPALEVTANYAINASLRRAIEADHFDPELVTTLIQRAASEHITLNAQQLGYAGGQRMKRAMIQLEASVAGEDAALTTLTNTLILAETLRLLPFEVNLWQAQNIWNDLLRRSDKTYWTQEFLEGFRRLGETMNIQVDELVTEEGVSAF
jgi:hypothetical protein